MYFEISHKYGTTINVCGMARGSDSDVEYGESNHYFLYKAPVIAHKMMSVLRNAILNPPPKKPNKYTNKQTKETTLLSFNILIMSILYDYFKDYNILL